MYLVVVASPVCLMNYDAEPSRNMGRALKTAKYEWKQKVIMNAVKKKAWHGPVTAAHSVVIKGHFHHHHVRALQRDPLSCDVTALEAGQGGAEGAGRRVTGGDRVRRPHAVSSQDRLEAERR